MAQGQLGRRTATAAPDAEAATCERGAPRQAEPEPQRPRNNRDAANRASTSGGGRGQLTAGKVKQRQRTVAGRVSVR
eukprot:3097595-Rhodomonas_salina.2